MATKSIYKNVNIKNKVLAKGLLTALENAEGRKGKEVQLQKSFEEIRGDDLKKLFKKR